MKKDTLNKQDKLDLEDNMIEKNDQQTEIVNESDLFVFANVDKLKSERIISEPYSYMKSVFRVFIKKPAAWISIITLIILALGILIIPLFTPEGFLQYDVSRRDIEPNNIHLWGTDPVGRDLFFMVWIGAGRSLWLAMINSFIIVTVGTIIGLIWGYFRKLDPLFIELYNLVTNIPSLLIYMLLAYVFSFRFPNMGIEARLIVSLTLVGWIGLARFIRNYTLIINNREYNIASKTLGTPAHRIMSKNLLPYLLGIIITEASLIIPGMISSEVTLSYFGLGLPSSSISIGALLDLGRSNFVLRPYQLLAPAGVLALIIFAFFLLGMAISDSLDPKKHH